MVVDIEDHACPCCQGALHRIGEDVSKRLDIVPAQLRVMVVRRPKYGCRTCEEVVVQAPAPARLIEGGVPTDATVAQVLVSKYADHLPLYRQAQIYARQGISLDRSTLADWVGQAAFTLRPVYERLFSALKGSTKLFADETTAPVLDPGRRRTKTGQLWAYARDDRPWGGTDPPGVAYVYAPDRKAERPSGHLAGFKGILQVDGYAGYRPLAESGNVELAFCWAHVRRRFYELAVAGPAPIASEALERIAKLYTIELNRKNALFAGSDGGGEHWAIIASLIETCKLNEINPQTYLTDVISRIANGHPNSRLDELLPWAYPAAPVLKHVA
jgi:transposase